MKLKDQKAESGEQGEDGKAKSTRMDTCRCRALLLEHVSQADGTLLKWMHALSQKIATTVGAWLEWWLTHLVQGWPLLKNANLPRTLGCEPTTF